MVSSSDKRLLVELECEEMDGKGDGDSGLARMSTARRNAMETIEMGVAMLSVYQYGFACVLQAPF